MKLTLVRGPEVVANSANAVTTPPLGVAYLAAYLRTKGHVVKIVDSVGEGIFQYAPIFEAARGLSLHGLGIDETAGRIEPEFADCIGVSCMFSQDWPAYKRLLAAVRERFPDAWIICGGEHISALPEFSMADCPEIDFCVRGEGEQPLAALLAALDGGTSVKSIPALYYRSDEGKILHGAGGERVKDIDALPRPAWDLVPIENYLSTGSGFGVNKGRNMPIMASRGCPYACTFCSNPQMWTPRWIARDPKAVVDEIEAYHRDYGANNFDFYDLTAIVRKDWILQFCAELSRRNLKITYQLPSGTRSEAIDAEVAAALRQTGCCHLVYAPESGSVRTLKLVNKRVSLSSLVKSMRAAVGEGMFVKMNIVIGFPDETWVDLVRTFFFLAYTAAIGVHDVFVYTFSPYPGSALFARLREEGRIPSLDESYFLDLTAYVKLTESISFCKHIPSAVLGMSRFFGLLLFYGISFTVRPLRLVQILGRLHQPVSDTRIELFLKSLLSKTATSAGLIAMRKGRVR